MRIAVITPAYNRKDLLVRLYKSLLEQTSFDFSWLIVDDGSDDNTGSFLHHIKNDSPFMIDYIRQKNGGKCRALNNAFDTFIDYDFYAVVDSDDMLIPDAISIISKMAEKYSGNEKIGAIFFRYYQSNSKTLIGPPKSSLNNDQILTRSAHDHKYGKYDGCVGYYRRALNLYRYAEFEGETYIAPTSIQMKMDERFLMIFTSVCVGIAEYQQGGITAQGRRLRLNNPMGMIHYCILKQKKDAAILVNLKYSIMGYAYKYYSGYSYDELRAMNINLKQLKAACRLPGWILSLVWRKKYPKNS